ncbi:MULTISPECIES: hypothetical protein [Photobacterium]|uniref:Uncharacterized protein n=1 Tax=Photobacterium ganghwense TaxID=320778 RepID=A0A0J1HIV2_9GAMM|nr:MULTISPECIES: hypothetical protein [Photobacterium]KLV11549.1 hypothetical protein ABT57_02115 [Photobacterium ganghwense]MBV1841495.1 hypothetical protein [Photobacterium ganghwense]PSU08417.1 hypothetical protein C9I92_12915 [Photobacterium ganghwense]QSV15225.1 hypothetical protein FH974_06470 [Photobacterium ganghwense]
MAKDKDLVNFGEEHELNSRLKSMGKRQTQDNRNKLKELGTQVKQELGKRVLTHDELRSAMEAHKEMFE